MFFFTQIKYQIFRTIKRSLLLLAVSFFLLVCMGFYLGAIESSENALKNLSDTVPVTVRVYTRTGSTSKHLDMKVKKYDKLVKSGVHDILCTMDAAASLHEDPNYDGEFIGGDTSITGANSLDAILSVSEDILTLADGYTSDFLAGEEALCVVSEPYAMQMDVKVGDTLTLDTYLCSHSPYRTLYDIPIGYQSVKVIGTYEYDRSQEYPPDMVVPTGWLRAAAEKAEAKRFYYSSFSAKLDDPMNLTKYKQKLKKSGFVEIEDIDDLDYLCDAISVEDEIFIKSAEQLRGNLRTLRQFALPFYALLSGIAAISIFLVLRSSQRDMAIANALGESKIQIGAVYFVSVMLVELAVSAVILPLMSLTILKVTAGQLVNIVCMYLLCVCAGALLALLLLLRFRANVLLTKTN